MMHPYVTSSPVTRLVPFTKKISHTSISLLFECVGTAPNLYSLSIPNMLSKASRIMYLFILFVAFALALPATYNDTSQSSGCTSHQWNIQDFSAFTAGPSGAPPNSPNIFNFDHISFCFSDPNFGVRAECQRSIAKGAGVLSDGRSYPCDGFGMSFQYFGASIQLKRVGVECEE